MRLDGNLAKVAKGIEAADKFGRFVLIKLLAFGVWQHALYDTCFNVLIAINKNAGNGALTGIILLQLFKIVASQLWSGYWSEGRVINE